MTRGGLPHSDIPGSKLVCSSPRLFAACHVLHRLLAPRHSPYTLSSLTIRNSKLTLTNRLHVNWSATVPCNTACVCGRKKLPFAEYSVVKKLGFASPLVAPGPSLPASSPAICYTSPKRSVVGQRPPSRSAQQSSPTSVHERLESLTHSPKLFQRARPLTTLTTRTGLPTVARSASRAGLPTDSFALRVQRAKVGGEYRARTGDLLVANQALSQLS